MKEYEAKREILGIFRENAGDFISGERISGKLGFTRAGAWKYIKKLRDDGYAIEAVPNRGYRLMSSPDVLHGFDISGSVKTDVIGRGNIYHYESISSTNDKAYELAEKGEAEGAVVIAEEQTHGKGRMGRKWVSPASGGVYMSVILRPKTGLADLSAITLAAGMAVVKAVRKTSGAEAGLKWPNDVFIGGKKICGILTEIKAQPDMVDFLVLGIGINVDTPPGELPEGAASLNTESARKVSRMELVRVVLEETEKIYFTFREEGFGALREECRSFSLLMGKRVSVKETGRSLEGTAEDIDEKGALIVRTDDGSLTRVLSGDVRFSQ